MSDYRPDGSPPVKERDPFVRFLLGCALVIGALLVIVIGGCGFFAWRLMRDESPGRPVEAFLLGDETRYWSVDLRPDDAGLAAMIARLDQVNAETRRRLLENSPLRGLPIPTRRSDLEEILPLKLELALWTSEASGHPWGIDGWAGRATLSKGGFRLRAGLKLMRWVLTRDAQAAEVVEVDGVKVTRISDEGHTAAFANVGNRLLVADTVERIRGLLGTQEGAVVPALARIAEDHESIRLEGEDGWAFALKTSIPGPTRPVNLSGAVASFDIAPDDALRFRILVPTAEGAGPKTLSPDEALAIVRSFLPRSPEEAITLEGGAPVLVGGNAWRIEGRISGLTKRLARVFGGSPSATPTDPSPQPTSDPRSGSLEAPTREGTPTPAR